MRHGEVLVEVLDEKTAGVLRRTSGAELEKFVRAAPWAVLDDLLLAVLQTHQTHQNLMLQVLRESEVYDGVAHLDSSFGHVDERLVIRLLIYAASVVVPDPLVDHPLLLRHIAPGVLNAVEPRSGEALRVELIEALEFHRRFRSAIKAGLIVPTHWYLASRIQRQIDHNFIASHSGVFEIPLAPEFASLAREMLSVRPIRARDGQIVLLTESESPQEKTSQIVVTAAGDPDDYPLHYETYQRITGVEEREGEHVAFSMQAPPETPEMYSAWVEASIRKAAFNRCVSLQDDLGAANLIGGTIVTPSTANWRLLRAIGAGQNQGRVTPLDTLAELQVPLLEGLSLPDLIRARRDIDAFQNLRRGFRQACRRITLGRDEPGFKRQVDELRDEFFEQGLDEIRRANSGLSAQLRRQVFQSAVQVSVAAAAAAVASQGAVLPAVLGGAAGGLTSIFQFFAAKRKELAGKPLLMLWKPQRGSSKKSRRMPK